MKSQSIRRSNWIISILITGLLLTSCAAQPGQATTAPVTATPETIAPTVEATESPAQPTVVAPVADKDVLYQDDFSNPASGWPEEKFDNYFIGYHEPEYYHVEITSANYKTTVFEPTKASFTDATIEVNTFTVAKKTAETGDFIYGPAFRRSGDQYYAFTISPRTKKWFVLKSSSNALIVLAEGTEESIHNLDTADKLRVDTQGENFSFYINDHLVGQVNDADYASGEVGMFVQTFDSPNLHIHFDSMVIRKLGASQPAGPESVTLYQDDFTNPASGWSEKKFDNYFIGYHEPEYYHIEITSTNYKTTVFAPNKQSFSDITLEVKAYTNSKKTSPTGDFSYGPVFHRSGDNYYAFTISPRTKHWTLLKSSPNSLNVIAEGTEEGINELDVEDVLRVDIEGSKFYLHINGKLVGQATDADYTNGEVGFYVQTLDSPNLHVHFDNLSIRNYEAPLICNVNALALNVRSGPGTSYASSVFLSKGDVIVPIGRNADGGWIKVRLSNSQEQGWIFDANEYVSCTAAIELLPVVNP